MYMLYCYCGVASVKCLFLNLGVNVLPYLLLGVQMSSYTIFRRGANVRGGKCPTLKNMARCLIN